jgi:hypothetical protein
MFSKKSLEITKKKLLFIYNSCDKEKIKKYYSELIPYYKNKNIYFRDFQWKSKQKSCLLIELIDLMERLEEHKDHIYGSEIWKYSHFNHFVSYLIKYIEKDIIYINTINCMLMNHIKKIYCLPYEIQQKIIIYTS